MKMKFFRRPCTPSDSQVRDAIAAAKRDASRSAGMEEIQEATREQHRQHMQDQHQNQHQHQHHHHHRNQHQQHQHNTQHTTPPLTTEYEYIRREYGYDYVPPSQYVPSHSMASTADEEKGAQLNLVVPGSDISDSVNDGAAGVFHRDVDPNGLRTSRHPVASRNEPVGSRNGVAGRRSPARHYLISPSNEHSSPGQTRRETTKIRYDRDLAGRAYQECHPSRHPQQQVNRTQYDARGETQMSPARPSRQEPGFEYRKSRSAEGYVPEQYHQPKQAQHRMKRACSYASDDSGQDVWEAKSNESRYSLHDNRAILVQGGEYHGMDPTLGVDANVNQSWQMQQRLPGIEDFTTPVYGRRYIAPETRDDVFESSNAFENDPYEDRVEDEHLQEEEERGDSHTRRRTRSRSTERMGDQTRTYQSREGHLVDREMPPVNSGSTDSSNKKKSKGLFGRFRKSIRGTTKKREPQRNPFATRDNLYASSDQQMVARQRSRSKALFEPPPSNASNITEDYRSAFRYPPSQRNHDARQSRYRGRSSPYLPTPNPLSKISHDFTQEDEYGQRKKEYPSRHYSSDQIDDEYLSNQRSRTTVKSRSRRSLSHRYSSDQIDDEYRLSNQSGPSTKIKSRHSPSRHYSSDQADDGYMVSNGRSSNSKSRHSSNRSSSPSRRSRSKSPSMLFESTRLSPSPVRSKSPVHPRRSPRNVPMANSMQKHNFRAKSSIPAHGGKDMSYQTRSNYQATKLMKRSSASGFGACY